MFNSISSLLACIFFLIISMNNVIWNMRRIRNDASIARVKRLIVDHHFYFIYLLQPLIDSSKQSEMDHNIGLNLFSCNSNNKIWLFWQHSTNVSFICSYNQFLFVSVSVCLTSPLFSVLSFMLVRLYL